VHGFARAPEPISPEDLISELRLSRKGAQDFVGREYLGIALRRLASAAHDIGQQAIRSARKAGETPQAAVGLQGEIEIVGDGRQRVDVGAWEVLRIPERNQDHHGEHRGCDR
jgi:hypothetical protein